MKTFRKATSEMEIPTLRHGNFHKIWNLKWKLWEIKTFRKLKSEKETLRAEHHQKKMHMFSNQYSFEMELSTLRHEHLNTIPTQTKIFQDEVLDCPPTAQSPCKAPQARILQSDLSPKKKLKPKLWSWSPTVDVWTMFEWQNVEGFFQVFILKRMGPYWCQVHAPSSSNAPPIIPTPSQIQNVKGHVKKLYTIFSRGCFKPQFSILESKSVSLGKNHAYWILDWMGLSNLSCRFKPARLFHHKAFED